MIGRGAFGEVWLARTVTGVYRAVKVIWREDFDNERDFEREFEAIRRYEPISRQHPGLVHILQVGRDEQGGFYYYVMEAADDLGRGTDIDPETYVAHTFRSALQEEGKVGLARVVSQGAQLAEALHHLHERNLIHRDVKLSNVIVVEGNAKLADIGLVAARGDRSFVGTEGYVPPEGAGSPAADIFSLGMVLYELATGKDRLDFPDVPSSLRENSQRELWQRVNRVVCRACARRVESRFPTAQDMARALRGEALPERRPWRWWAAGAAAVVLALAAVGLGTRSRPSEGLSITTEPPGAEVFAGERLVGVTPLTLEERPVEGVTYEVMLAGYRQEVIDYGGERDPRRAIHLVLEDTRFPQPGAVWVNSLGLEFKPTAQGHRLDLPVHADLFLRFAVETKRPFEGEIVMQTIRGKAHPIPIVSAKEARAFAEWMQAKDQAAGYIGPAATYRAEVLEDPALHWPNRRLEFDRTKVAISPFLVHVDRPSYGSLVIHSEPSGATVLDSRGEVLGTTPYEVSRIRSGPVSFELRLAEYRPVYVSDVVEPNGLLEIRARMELGAAVEMGKPWVNSLGRELVPVGEVLVATTETPVVDYLRFCQATGHDEPLPDAFPRQNLHPVHRVSREDAEAFCAWLTETERAAGELTGRHEYRLPGDTEWSTAAGLPVEKGTTPAARNGSVRGVFPWGYEWPPPDGAANLADQSLLRNHEAAAGTPDPVIPGPACIEGYDDSFPHLAWVNELRPNRHGLYHLSGNVWEWVSDNFLGGVGTGTSGTIRGGSFQTAAERECLSGYRRSLAGNAREEGVGFRYVLARTGSN
jgi:formylglycine-generating enzyme required for sulfatase activity